MLRLEKPDSKDLSFRQSLLEDPATMAYNEPWGGCIPFPPERWEGWAARWLGDGERFYRYVLDENDRPVGEVAWHREAELILCDVIIHSAWRGRGYGKEALALLLAAAKEAGLPALWDNIGEHNAPALALFLGAGFVEVSRDQGAILVKKSL